MATHAPITGAPTRAPFIPAPPAAITRVLSRFDREQLASFIVVAIDLLDVAAGDPDLEDGNDAETITAPDDFRLFGVDVTLTDDHEPDDDAKGDIGWTEWGQRTTAEKKRPSERVGNPSVDADDEDSDPDQCAAGDDRMGRVMTSFGQRWGASEDDADGGDVAWPERMRQPDAMMGGVAGDTHEDAEPGHLPPHWQPLLIPANDTVPA